MEENILNEEMTEGGSELVPCENGGRIKRIFKKARGIAEKIGMRNVVIVSSLVLIGTAVILNFALFGNSVPNVSEGEQLGMGITGDEDAAKGENDAYFASVQLSRKQARDQALAVLQTVVDSQSANATSKEQASADISRIAAEIEAEANIETLIKSKGFEECIAVIGEGSASIIVRSDGLLPNELSQIKEIVYEEAGIDPIGIKIIEQSTT